MLCQSDFHCSGVFKQLRQNNPRIADFLSLFFCIRRSWRKSRKYKQELVGGKVNWNMKGKENYLQGSSLTVKQRVLTPSEKLKKRIEKDIIAKKYIGDIHIDDDEYEIIKSEFRAKYRQLVDSYSHKLIDLLFVVALVQIGIRFYDGKYWLHVARELGQENLPTNQQTWIGNAFLDTVSKYHLIALPSHEKVSNILMHGFVSNHYANNFFDFLFEYYRIDLERDIENNNAENMNRLIDAMVKNDNTNRTYLIVQQTSDAIKHNRRGANIRIRRLLRLIDKCFWNQSTVVNGRNRLTSLFNKWRKESENLQHEYSLICDNMKEKKGKRSFSSPYLNCDYNTAEVSLILPSQLIKIDVESEEIELKWEIIIGEEAVTIPLNNFSQVITGYKTERATFKLNRLQVLQNMSFQLFNGQQKLRTFKEIPIDCVRFFDLDGDFLNPESLPNSTVYAFSNKESTFQSKSISYIEKFDEVHLTIFEFELGDILLLPDGNILSVGNKLVEGLLQRGLAKRAYVLCDNEKIDIFRETPSIVVKMLPTRVNGTLICVNENRFRLSDMPYLDFPLNDRSGESAYILDMSQYNCETDGVYSIVIDVPNDRTDRHWKYCVLSDFRPKFEDCPYIFKSKGTIVFAENFRVTPKSYMDKNEGENSFNFNIIPNDTHIGFTTITDKNESIDICIEIPALHWKFDNAEWEIEKPNELWHSHFPTIISLQYPEDSLKLCMNEELDSEKEESRSVEYTKSKSTGQFVCDVTRFHSWFNGDHASEIVYIKLGDGKIPFIDVITKSRLISCLITGDFENNILHGTFNIIGQAEYFVDVEVNGKVLVEKQLIIDDMIVVPMQLESGTYKVSIFETENDEAGFDDSTFNLLGEYKRELINPYNLSGKTIEICHITKGEKNHKISLGCSYFVKDLSFSGPDSRCYYGKLIAEGDAGKILATIPVRVDFFDKTRLQLAFVEFIDDDEPTSFLYDNQKKIIVKNELEGLSRSVRYRRYEDIYRDGYQYIVEFVNNNSMKNFNNSDSFSQDRIAYSAPSRAISYKNYDNQWEKEKNEMDEKSIVDNEQKPASESLLCADYYKEPAKNVGQENDNVALFCLPDKQLSDISNDESCAEDFEQSTLAIKVSETGLSPLVFNCLQKAGISELRHLDGIIKKNGIKGLNNINKLNSRMKEEVVSLLREYRII